MGVTGVGLKGLLRQAQRAALKRSQRLSTGHVLLLMLQAGGESAGILGHHGVREPALLSALKVVEGEPASALDVALERASKLAAARGHAEAGTLHLLLAIARDPRTAGHRCLEQVGVGVNAICGELTQILGNPAARPAAGPGEARIPRPSTSHHPRRARAPTPPKRDRGAEPCPMPSPTAEAQDATPPPAPTPNAPAKAPSHGLRPRSARIPAAGRRPSPLADTELGPFDLDPSDFPLLTDLGRNLTAEAAAGRIDPVIARDREIELLLDVLARRRANNPLLVGPPGVGKTAVVEGLALRLASGGEGVRGLDGRIVIEISAGALVSGTGVRGALAERMRQLREEVASGEGRVTLFIDEIHSVVGGDGPDDLASELKATLARGELPCIGATTETELRRCFERDAALARRFSPIRVEEPSVEDAVRILRGLAPRYEKHHGVAFDDRAIEAAVHLSARYIIERQLPDKAVGVIDLAAARVRRRGGAVVDEAAVAAVVAEQSGVPFERLMGSDAGRLLRLEAGLAERIVGHQESIARVADVLRKAAAGFRGSRPLGTFLLLGPTGVGKTELAKAVADLVFPSGALTRFDMSELSEAHAVARLLGAPPGYIGHDDGGQLTEAVRRRPYQVLLLDEAEKAHPDVLLSLLPMLDEGRLTDARGRTVDFKHTIVFMTSNLGSAEAAPAPRIGFGAKSDGADTSAEARTLRAARAALPPELWNRIDEPLFFAALCRDEVREIARRMLGGVGATLLREHALTLEVDPSAIEALIEAGGFDAALGARPMRRTIGRLVESPLATALLSDRFGRGDTVLLRGRGVELVFEQADSVEAAE